MDDFTYSQYTNTTSTTTPPHSYMEKLASVGVVDTLGTIKILSKLNLSINALEIMPFNQVPSEGSIIPSEDEIFMI